MSVHPQEEAALVDRLRQMAANLRRDKVLIADPETIATDLDLAAAKLGVLRNLLEAHRGHNT